VHGRRAAGLPKQPTVKAEPPDAGAEREPAEITDTIATLAAKYWENEGNSPESRAEARTRWEGKHVTPWHRITIASGHMAQLARTSAPAEPEHVKTIGLPDPGAEPIGMLAAEFWRAYARVRAGRGTTSDGVQRVTLIFDAGGVWISTTSGHPATYDECETREYVPLGTSIDANAGHRVSFDDRLFWQLRGRAYLMRQNAREPGKRSAGPALFEDASGLVVVIMPLAEDAEPAPAAAEENATDDGRVDA
jgi:hypothetical protein